MSTDPFDQPTLTEADIANIRAAISANVLAILRYQNVLAADALNPQKTYSLDGETVQRNEWREGIGRLKKSLIDENKELRKMISYSGGVTWLGKTPAEQTPYDQQ